MKRFVFMRPLRPERSLRRKSLLRPLRGHGEGRKGTPSRPLGGGRQSGMPPVRFATPLDFSGRLRGFPRFRSLHPERTAVWKSGTMPVSGHKKAGRGRAAGF